MNKNFLLSAILLFLSIMSIRAAAAPVLCRATEGEFADRVVLSWEPAAGIERYGVYRSTMEKGDFEELAIVTAPSYEDTTAEPGLQYWYRVDAMNGEVPLEPGTPAAGHRTAALPAGIDIDLAARQKTRPAPRFETGEEKLRDGKYRALVQKYSKNPAELGIIYHVVRSYVKKGTLIALNGFGNYDLDYEKREITLYHKNYACMVHLKSSRLFRMFVEAQMEGLMNMVQRPFADILIDNMTAYCIYRDVRKITDADGRTRFVPCYDAVGVSTELYRDYREWKKNTLIFATGNKDLENKIKQFREQGLE